MNIAWDAFTPWPALAGGALIGLAAALLLLCNGRITGISGIVGRLLDSGDGERGWRLAFIGGLLLAPTLWRLLGGDLPRPEHVPDGLAGGLLLAAAGVLTGIGTQRANGCTSGHGVCGLARLSRRSLAAVLTFMVAGFTTVFAVRHLL